MTRVATRFERVVQIAHDLHGLDVDWVFCLDAVLFVAGDKAEQMDVLVQLGERKLVRLVFLKIVQGDSSEVGNDDVSRHLFAAPFPLQALDVVHRLGVGLTEIFVARLVLREQHALPEEVDEPVTAPDVFHGLFKAGDLPPPQAEDGEEVVPERLRLSVLTTLSRPISRKGDSAGADFIPAKRHS